MTPCPLPCKFDCEYEDKDEMAPEDCLYQVIDVIPLKRPARGVFDIPGVVMENARKCRQMGLMALAEQRMKDDATRVLCYGVPLKTFGNFIMGGQGG